jgi:hypothetical protein
MEYWENNRFQYSVTPVLQKRHGTLAFAPAAEAHEIRFPWTRMLQHIISSYLGVLEVKFIGEDSLNDKGSDSS